MTRSNASPHARGQIMNRCLGWPEPIQGDPASEAQLAFNGIYAGTGEAYQREESKRLLAERGTWRQLVQIDSEDAAGMMWGDGGRVHFMMREADLVARAWNQAWLSTWNFEARRLWKIASSSGAVTLSASPMSSTHIRSPAPVSPPGAGGGARRWR
jgi:hypothetical protein